MNSRKLTVSVPRGFSVIELMIALVLLAISAALALPSYREMVEKRQITYGAEKLMAFVNATQSESIKQNSILTVSYSRTAENDWCVGAVLGDAACDCEETSVVAADYCAIDSQAWVITNSDAGNRDLVTSVTGDGSYSFDPVRGLLIDLDDSLTVDMRSNSDLFNLRLSVSATGQVSLCSPDSDHDVPGYAACPAQPEDEA